MTDKTEPNSTEEFVISTVEDVRLPDVTDYAFPPEKPYDPEPRREQMRGILASSLVGVLAATVLLSFIAVWADWITPSDAKELLSVVFPPIVALAGTALGFYFGGRRT